MEPKGKKVKPDKANLAARMPEAQGGTRTGMTLEEIQEQTKTRASKLEEMKETLARLKEQNAIDEWVRKEQDITDTQRQINTLRDAHENIAAEEEAVEAVVEEAGPPS